MYIYCNCDKYYIAIKDYTDIMRVTLHSCSAFRLLLLLLYLFTHKRLHHLISPSTITIPLTITLHMRTLLPSLIIPLTFTPTLTLTLTLTLYTRTRTCTRTRTDKWRDSLVGRTKNVTAATPSGWELY